MGTPLEGETMATFVLSALIGLGVVLGMRSFIKGRGSCGDCDCSCPVKEEKNQSHTS